eukprot:5467567-Prymnesium_polylepis.1
MAWHTAVGRKRNCVDRPRRRDDRCRGRARRARVCAMSILSCPQTSGAPAVQRIERFSQISLLARVAQSILYI